MASKPDPTEMPPRHPDDTPAKLVIRDQKNPRSYLCARVETDGTLLYEGCDADPKLENFVGRDEYEYALAIKPEQKDAVLLHLLRERFASVHDFKAWLQARGIASEFGSF
ncbi:MAG: hypothetical protein M5U26_09830 [Planctomycetota bacterium]|nr:hypothetical protein [Planctomycetota bacterium]